ncbi:hypothetical protein N1614_00350 [Adlercreutzia muris]|uniref:hypothetical protein n=1 Tax=Adlercreutzia muris TaxID=1796610 RepID=UPI0021D5F1E9|nr:hypothetical protein [Adlercreutzia muris]MCU7583806.1 hypothetical protein [Adlercreutzia muris]
MMRENEKERLAYYYRETIPAEVNAGKPAALARIAQEAQAPSTACPQAAEARGAALFREGPLQLEAPPAFSFPRFVWGQLRFVSPWVWAAQLALIALVVASAGALPSERSAVLIAVGAAVLTVLVGVPDVLRSCERGVAELEYACRFDCRQVLAARCALLGLSDVAVLTAAIVALPALAGADPFLVFLYACTPFFALCAGVFWIVGHGRRSLTARCMALGAVMMLAAWGLWTAAPALYAGMSATAWSLLAGVAFLAALHEGRHLFRAVGSGLDALPVLN